MRRADAGAWRAWHLVYHGDRERLLAEVVRPVAAEALAAGEATHFYFVRYWLGGPHVRLRLLPAPGRAADLGARVHRAAAAFFHRVPSTAPEPDETVLRRNRGIAATDPFGAAEVDRVHPDNSVHEAPLHLEVDRYGGPALHGHSLDLFALGSVEVLRLLEGAADGSPGRRTADHLRLLARQAWGHAAGEASFAELAGYGVRMFGRLEGLLPVADAAFERGRTELCAVVEKVLRDLAAAPDPLARGARALGRRLRGTDAAARRSICVSHLHMTANRLGLRNTDEVYLCRMLQRAVAAVRDEQPDAWRAAWDAHARWRREPAPPLGAQARAALRSFAAPAAVAAA